MTEKIISLTMAVLTIGVIFFVGFITGRDYAISRAEVSPEECVSVCADYFERYGC